MNEKSKDDGVLNLKREIRRLKAVEKQNDSIIKGYEKELDLEGKIISVIQNSIDKIPLIEAPVFNIYDQAHSEEIAVLLMSDVHIGKKTTSYNPKVFVKRLRVLEKSMMSIITAQRSIRPITKLVLVFNGDFIDAESIYPGQAVDGISIPIIDQIFSVGVPELVRFLMFCLSNFESVEVYCQSGNHGRLNASKWSTSKSTNWDFVLYKALMGVTQDQPRLKWHIDTKDWKQTFHIMGEGFLATHGDMIKMYYNMPYYGMSRQAMRWANAYRDKIKLTHFLFSHFHSCGVMRFNNVVIYVNGSFVTDDTFGEQYIGVASVPEQLLFAVHPKYGVTWNYKLKLL